MKRKIAFISEHASPLATLGGVDAGGQNVYVGKLAKHISKLGYKIDIFTRWDDARLPQIIDWDQDVKVIHIKAGPITFIPKEQLFQYMDEFTTNMSKFIEHEEEKYKLIHANFWMSAYVASKIKKQFKIPFVITFHALGKIRRIFQGTSDKFPNSRFAVEEQVIKEANQIIAECPQDREDLINHYNASPEKITIIPAGFDENEFYPVDKLLSRLLLNLKLRQPIILQLGRIVQRKGIDNVIRGLSILRKKYKIKAQLLIVGGETDLPNARATPEIGRLRKIAQSEGIKKHVIFIGRPSRETLKYYYSAADIFVSTPWYEPFGMTPLESMACGTPVIGANVGGIKYTVQDGKTGYLVPPKDPQSLAQKLADILKNKKIANFFKENAIKRVNSQFSWEKVANLTSKFYEKAICHESQISEKEKQLHIIENGFETLSQTITACRGALRIPLLDAAQAISKCLSKENKVYVCGNGGSASDSQHFAAELVGHYLLPTRKGLPVISLNTDTAIMTAVSNDFSYNEIFSRQINALGQASDILIGISTSGNSKNINSAFIEAHKLGMTCIGILGKGGGDAINLCDIALVVPSDDTQRIQEIHANIIHTLCELVEKQLFSNLPTPLLISAKNSYIPLYTQSFKKELGTGEKNE